MKRKLFLIIAAIAVIASAMGIFVACGNKGGGKDAEKDNISRMTDTYYAGECELFAVSVESGKRERTFIADGKATDVIDFCRITVLPLKANAYESVNFVLSDGEKTLSGEIKKSDFGEYCLDIQLDFVPKAVDVTAGAETGKIELINVLNGTLSSKDAVNIAKDEFKDKIAAEYADGKPEREIYVKLITGDRNNYYYYVSFIGDGVDYWALLIDPETGDVVSKR